MMNQKIVRNLDKMGKHFAVVDQIHVAKTDIKPQFIL